MEVSERFLWDVRQTVNDLLCENYAGHFRTLAHRHGMRLSIEAYDEPPCDDMTYAGRADEPMAEFWSWDYSGVPMSLAFSCTEMASAAHVYGRPILGAEAFTATDKEKWQGHPAIIKSLGDWAFCEGINRFVFHRYALQPWTRPCARHEHGALGPALRTHADLVGAIARPGTSISPAASSCLQQGLFVADLCFLAPESSPQRFKSPVKSGFDRPGYNFDGCPPEVVLTRMSVRGRPARAARRHELPHARAAAGRDDDAAPAAEDSRSGRGRGHGSRLAAEEVAQPGGLPEVRRGGARAGERTVGRRPSARRVDRASVSAKAA